MQNQRISEDREKWFHAVESSPRTSKPAENAHFESSSLRAFSKNPSNDF